MVSDSLPSDDRTAPNAFDIALDALVRDYRITGNAAELQSHLASLVSAGSIDALVAGADRYRDIPEIAGPMYERVVEEHPTNVRALIALANAYWLTGRGPEVVGALADRAKTIDPRNRAAWHLWALTESSPRRRVDRWRRVCIEFSDDDLARANLADNAASLAGAEQDPAALDLALQTYADLRGRAKEPAQIAALDQALTTLRQWRV
jgi:hypothetical protein